MSLRLSPEDEKQYLFEMCQLDAKKQACIRTEDARGAKHWRQQIGALYQKYKAKQLPPDPPTAYERECAMTLEQRVDRIEQVLKLGHYKI